jgi:hypothetical protein
LASQTHTQSTRHFNMKPCFTRASKLAFFLSALRLDGLAVQSAGPQPGSTYSKTFYVPVAGKQTIRLHVCTLHTARLQLHGHIELDESITYTQCPKTRTFSFVLSSNTVRILSRYQTTLKQAGYVKDRDEAFVQIKIMLLPKMRIDLQREL